MYVNTWDDNSDEQSNNNLDQHLVLVDMAMKLILIVVLMTIIVMKDLKEVFGK